MQCSFRILNAWTDEGQDKSSVGSRISFKCLLAQVIFGINKFSNSVLVICCGVKLWPMAVQEKPPSSNSPKLTNGWSTPAWMLSANKCCTVSEWASGSRSVESLVKVKWLHVSVLSRRSLSRKRRCLLMWLISIPSSTEQFHFMSPPKLHSKVIFWCFLL